MHFIILKEAKKIKINLKRQDLDLYNLAEHPKEDPQNKQKKLYSQHSTLSALNLLDHRLRYFLPKYQKSNNLVLLGWEG